MSEYTIAIVHWNGQQYDLEECFLRDFDIYDVSCRKVGKHLYMLEDHESSPLDYEENFDRVLNHKRCKDIFIQYAYISLNEGSINNG